MIAAALAFASAIALLAAIMTARIATRLRVMPVGYHHVVRLAACLLPHTCALDWAEETQAQLDELTGRRRHRLLANLLATQPVLCATTWLVHRQHSRALRQKSSTLNLVARLHGHLQPPPVRSRYLPADVPDNVTLLRTLGLARNLRRWRTRTIPPLRLARQLLSTQTPELQPARIAARELLNTRERAHLIARGLQRDNLNLAPAQTIRPSDRNRHRHLELLRTQAAHHATTLRTQLDHYLHQHGDDPVEDC